MNQPHALLFFILLIFTQTYSHASEVLYGTARDKSQNIIYYEKHQSERDTNRISKKIITTYYDKNGKPFASAQADFSKNLYVPNYEFQDSRFDLKLTSTLLSKDSVKLTKEQKGQVKMQTVQISDNSLLGPGFDNYVVNHFSSLDDEIVFIVPGLLDYFRFTLKESTKAGDKSKVFSLSPVSVLIAWFVDSISVEYDLTEKKIKRFTGLSNINSDQNKPQAVTIDYGKEKPATIVD